MNSSLWIWCTGKRKRYFLSGTDESAADPWNSYFLSELPYPVSSVAEALESLKPTEVLQAEAAGLTVQRQGEWFLVPCQAPPRSARIYKHERLLNRDINRFPSHRATYYATYNGVVHVKGTLRHTASEHRMVTLRDWHAAYENTALLSLSAAGRVD